MKPKIHRKGDASFAAKLKEMDTRLSRFQKSHQIGRHRLVLIPDELVLDITTSSVAYTDLNLSAYVSTDAFAVLIRADLYDTGSATNDVYMLVKKKGGTTHELITRGYHLNSFFAANQGIVALDDNFKVQYQVQASGASTAIARIHLLGYFEQI